MTAWANGENVISVRPPTVVIAVTVNVVSSIRREPGHARGEAVVPGARFGEGDDDAEHVIPGARVVCLEGGDEEPDRVGARPGVRDGERDGGVERLGCGARVGECRRDAPGEGLSVGGAGVSGGDGCRYAGHVIPGARVGGRDGGGHLGGVRARPGVGERRRDARSERRVVDPGVRVIVGPAGVACPGVSERLGGCHCEAVRPGPGIGERDGGCHLQRLGARTRAGQRDGDGDGDRAGENVAVNIAEDIRVGPGPGFGRAGGERGSRVDHVARYRLRPPEPRHRDQPPAQGHGQDGAYHKNWSPTLTLARAGAGMSA